MSTFSVTIEVGDLSGSEYQKLSAIVATGSTYAVLPRNILDSIRARPMDTVRFELADGSCREFEVGQVRMLLDNRERIVLVVFGENEMAPRLGSTTLDAFGVGVDANGSKLIPVDGLLKFAGSERYVGPTSHMNQERAF